MHRQGDNMSLYEVTFILRQDVAPQEVEKATERYSKIITDNGGEIIKVENWGLRNLAYLIKKNRKGYFTMLGIKAPYEALQELERQLRISEDVIRYMSIKAETLSKDASFMTKTRADKDDEGDSFNNTERKVAV